MINNCYDLLRYIHEHNGSLHFPADPESEFGIDHDTIDQYIDELNNSGYINRYMRSCGITAEGKEFVDSN